MRPVAEQFQITQGFASLATAGVVGNMQGSMVQVLVAMYGNYQPNGHAGTDIGCPVGTPVYAARPGTVVLCDWDVNLPGDDSWSASGYFQRFAFYKRFGGRLLVIKVAPNDYDVYAHLSDWKVSYGQQVSEGQLVALSGDSSSGLDGQLGPHLHTERIVDLTYSTGNGLIYGRMDPTSVWARVTAQGAHITPVSEEDDMPTPEQLWKHKLVLDGKEFEAGDILVYARKNAEGAKNNAETAAVKSTAALTAAQAAPGLAVQVLLNTKLPAPDGSGKSYTVADYLIFGWWYAMQAKDKPTGSMDLAALNKAIDESVANIVPDLQITVKENPNG